MAKLRGMLAVIMVVILCAACAVAETTGFDRAAIATLEGYTESTEQAWTLSQTVHASATFTGDGADKTA